MHSYCAGFCVRYEPNQIGPETRIVDVPNVAARFLYCIVVGICLAASPLIAQAQLQIVCPIDWSQIPPALRQRDLDTMLLGVKIRDWKPEFLDELARKYEECMSKDKWPDSLKEANRENVQRMLARRNEYFGVRDENAKQGQMALRTAKSAEIARQQGIEIPLDPQTGQPLEIQLRYYEGSGYTALRWTCGATGVKRTGWITEESIKTIAYYTNACLQSEMATQQAAMAQKENLEMLLRFYAEIPKFAKKVADISATSNASADSVNRLKREYQQLVDSVKPVTLQADEHPQLKRAAQEIVKLDEQIDKKACDAGYARAKFPDVWRTAYYLEESNQPVLLPVFVCDAARKGAQVRYLSGGVLSKEGIEIKGKTRNVQIFTEMKRIPGGDPKSQLLIPVAAKIDGQQVTLTRQNFRAFIAELASAMMNE